jgi:hypothetical protein
VPLIAVDAASCRVLFRIVEDGGAAVGR